MDLDLDMDLKFQRDGFRLGLGFIFIKWIWIWIWISFYIYEIFTKNLINPGVVMVTLYLGVYEIITCTRCWVFITKLKINITRDIYSMFSKRFRSDDPYQTN